MAQARVDREGGDVPDEDLPVTRRRDRAARIVSIGTGTDDRGIADPARNLSCHPAGRGGGGEIAAAVAGDGAHRAVLRRLAARMFQGVPQFPPACFGMEIEGLAERDTVLPAKGERPVADQQHWRDRSITSRAARTGLRGPKTPATAPARRAMPSITHASISCVPARVNTLPRPAA